MADTTNPIKATQLGGINANTAARFTTPRDVGQVAPPAAPVLDAERRLQELEDHLKDMHAVMDEALSVIKSMAACTLNYIESPGKFMDMDTIGQMIVGISTIASEKGEWLGLLAEGVDCISVDQARDRRRVVFKTKES